MMASWRRWRALDTADRRLAWQALTLMVALHCAVRLLPFGTTRAYLDRARSGRRFGPAAPRDVPPDRIIWAVRAVGSRLPGTTCLIEALAAETLLQRHGHTASLKIGVRRGSIVSLDAHAWVECDGVAVIGTTPALSEYVVLS